MNGAMVTLKSVTVVAVVAVGAINCLPGFTGEKSSESLMSSRLRRAASASEGKEK